MPAEESQLSLQVVYALIIIWGLIDCFFGFRLIRLTLSLLSGAAGAVLGAYLANALQPTETLWLIGGGVAGLILGILLGWALFKLVVGLAGAFFGAFLLSPFVGHLPPWAAVLALIVGCAVTGALAVALTRPVIQAATAVTGAFRTVFGVMFFLGGPDILLIFSDPAGTWSAVLVHRNAAVAALALAIFGFFFQQFGLRKPDR